MNVAAYSMIKRLTPIFVFIIEFLLFGKRESMRTCIAVFWMILGTAIVAQYDTLTLGFLIGFIMSMGGALIYIYDKYEKIKNDEKRNVIV